MLQPISKSSPIFSKLFNYFYKQLFQPFSNLFNLYFFKKPSYADHENLSLLIFWVFPKNQGKMLKKQKQLQNMPHFFAIFLKSAFFSLFFYLFHVSKNNAWIRGNFFHLFAYFFLIFSFFFLNFFHFFETFFFFHSFTSSQASFNPHFISLSIIKIGWGNGKINLEMKGSWKKKNQGKN